MQPAEVQSVVVHRRWALAPFEIWVAVAAVYAGVSHFLGTVAGNALLVQRAFPWVVNIWSLLYALGGISILVGLYLKSPAIEGFGLCLLGSGITVAFIASLYVGSIPIIPAILTQGGIAAACGVRLWTLRRLSNVG